MTSQKSSKSAPSSMAATVKKLLSPRGREQLSPIPHSPAVGQRRLPTEADRIRQLIKGERLKAEMEAAGRETFEEADDFEVGDDYDPSSPYEEIFDPVAAEEARRKPVPKRASDKDDDDADGGDTAEPAKNKAVLGDKTYSGEELSRLVEFVRTAPKNLIDNLFSAKDTEKPQR